MGAARELTEVAQRPARSNAAAHSANVAGVSGIPSAAGRLNDTVRPWPG
jgi:hypothetical protein